MELKNINQIDKAAKANRFELFRFGTALFFIVCIMLYIFITSKSLINELHEIL